MEIKEFLKSKGCWSSVVDGIITFHNVKPEDILEFTKYHVQEVLRRANNHAKMYNNTENIGNAILDCYPLEQIK